MLEFFSFGYARRFGACHCAVDYIHTPGNDLQRCQHFALQPNVLVSGRCIEAGQEEARSR